MSERPSQFRFEYSSIFQDESVVRAYRYRPQYPAATFDLLVDLLPANCRPRAVLDAGCGTGFVARPLAPLVERVDAVDFSGAAIREGRRLPGGDHPRLRWIEGPIESVAVDPPYCLITAGASMHWFDWDVVFPRFARLLATDGLFVVVGMAEERPDWMRDRTGAGSGALFDEQGVCAVQRGGDSCSTGGAGAFPADGQRGNRHHRMAAADQRMGGKHSCAQRLFPRSDGPAAGGRG